MLLNYEKIILNHYPFTTRYIGIFNLVSDKQGLWVRLCTELVNSQFCSCTSLIPRLMTVVFGIGTRLHVHMHTKLENRALHKGQQPDSVVNSFIDQKLEGHWVVIELCTVISIKISLLNIVVLTRKKKEIKNTKNDTFTTTHFYV